MANWTDLAEHTDTLIAVIGVLAGIIGFLITTCGFLIWRTISRIEKKLEEVVLWVTQFTGQCSECKVNIENEIQNKRTKSWTNYFWPHTHYPVDAGGGVKVPREVK